MKWSAKASRFAAWNFFALNLKWSEKTVFEQKFAFSLVVFLFTCGNFTLIFTVFSIFWIGFYFLNGFPNPFIVPSRPSFLFSQWNFFELYVRTCPAMFFFISSSRFLLRPHDVTTTSNLFFTIQRIWIVLGCCLFYDSKRSIGEVLFLINFWSKFWSGKWNAWKNLEWFWCWTKVKSRAKRECFLFTLLFLREREIDVWKNFF